MRVASSVCSTSRFCYQKLTPEPDAGRGLEIAEPRSLAAPHRELQEALTAETQKRNFNPNCKLRAPWELSIWPKFDAPCVCWPLNSSPKLKIGMLNTLTASTRNSRLCLSVTENAFPRLKFTALYPGPRNAPTGQLPKVPGPGWETAAGLRKLKCGVPAATEAGSGPKGRVWGTPGTQLGRVEKPPVPERSWPAKTVCAKPV